MPLDDTPHTPLAIVNEEDIVTFLSSKPSPGKFDNLTKHELQLIAQYLGIHIPSEWNKPAILDALKSQMFVTSNPSEDPPRDAEECEDGGRVDDSRNVEASAPVHSQIQPSTLSPADYLKLRELELKFQQERHAQEIQLEREKLKVGLEQQQLDNQQRESDRALQSRAMDLGYQDKSSICSNFSDRLKVIPPFQESDVLEFFNSFEKIALGFKWPRKEWSIVAQTAFKGKARKLYDSLSFSQCGDYDLLKSEILKIYTLTPEAYRQQFRKLQKKSEESHTDFATRLEHSFLMWLRSNGVLSADDRVDGTKLYNLMLVEQFLMRISKVTEFYLRDKEMDGGKLK